MRQCALGLPVFGRSVAAIQVAPSACCCYAALTIRNVCPVTAGIPACLPYLAPTHPTASYPDGTIFGGPIDYRWAIGTTRWGRDVLDWVKFAGTNATEAVEVRRLGGWDALCRAGAGLGPTPGLMLAAVCGETAALAFVCQCNQGGTPLTRWNPPHASAPQLPSGATVRKLVFSVEYTLNQVGCLACRVCHVLHVRFGHNVWAVAKNSRGERTLTSCGQL